MPKITRHTTFSLLGLMLLLGACGQSVTPSSATAKPIPSGPTPSGMVRLNITAKAAQAKAIRTQGLPTADDGSVPAGTFAVTLRDSGGTVLTFKDGVYAPDGNGSPVLTLNAANTYAASVDLPIGTYSFETSDKADSGDDVLLAYGPADENTQVVDGTHNSVALKLHAVLDPAQSSFGPAAPGTVSINDLLNLRLFGKTGLAGGSAYSVPSGDVVLEGYALGAPEQGTLNGPGSALGVSVVAGDVPSTSSLNVTAKFKAWIRTAGADVASLQSQTLTYSTPVSRTSPNVSASIETVNVTANTPTTLYGSAFSASQVETVRVYDAGVLIGSSDPAEQGSAVSAITFIADDNDPSAWSMPWTPTTDGAHDLSVRVSNKEGQVTYALPTPPASGYASDFQDGKTAKWTTSQIITAPGGKKFLGGFQYNDQTSLKLSRLPAHTQVTVSFDLYMINSMDGYNSTENGDGLGERWTFGVEGSPLLIDTNFANNEGDGFTQAYPGTRGDGTSHAPKEGAAAVNSLGYGNDAVYHITKTFPHTGSDLQLNFAGQGYQDYGDETWGLNNVQVSTN